MKPSRASFVTLLVASSLVGSYLLLRVVYKDLPTLPRSAFFSLLLMGVAEATLASSVRARLAGRPRTKPILPIVVARTAALAKASTVVAAVSCGFWAATLAFVLLHRDDFRRATVDADAITAVFSLVAGAVLLTAALRLEHACRVPDPPPELDLRDPPP